MRIKKPSEEIQFLEVKNKKGFKKREIPSNIKIFSGEIMDLTIYYTKPKIEN